jgi:hypothetical protein
MKFKKWLMNENPDEVIGTLARSIAGKPLVWREGRTFSLFNGYYLYSVKGESIIHEGIANRIKDCYKTIIAVLKNEVTVQELDDCLTSQPFLEAVPSLESKGTISPEVVNQLLKTKELMDRKKHEENNEPGKFKFVAYRALSIQNLPEITLGRIWPEHKIISFWNRSLDIFNQSNNIFNFVKNFGNPIEYHYEVQNDLLTYEEFTKKQSNKPNFDPSVVHTMAPGSLKSQLQNMMGMRKSKSIDIRDKQLVQTSENRLL